jgi:hypothetical protein
MNVSAGENQNHDGMEEKKLKRLLILLLCVFSAKAQETFVTGKVTYLSIGTLYGSVGRESGLQDSTRLYVVEGKDTVAALKVIAVSSKSCACIILNTKRDLKVGDTFTGTVLKLESGIAVQSGTITSNPRWNPAVQPRDKNVQLPAIAFDGRISLQYYTSRFESSNNNFNQPGIVFNVRARSRDIPLTLDIYSNLRTIGRRGASPFSRDATNESRIYRFSLEYNDQQNIITVGRIIMNYFPAIGSIDGVSYSRRFGNFTVGTSFGFQPGYKLQGTASDTRKIALFAQYQINLPYTVSIGGAYSRAYKFSEIDRESVSLMINAFTTGGLSLYAYGDVDLRRKQFELSPSVSTAMATLYYAFTDFLTLGLGTDASRSVYPFSSVRSIPDSLLDRTLRSGVTITVHVTPMRGINFNNTYSPRSSRESFGREYTNISAFYISNVFSSGAQIRGTFSISENEYTHSQGYGINLQRNLFGVDAVLRYQRTRYRINQVSESTNAETLGADLMVFFARQLSMITSFDSVRGYGMNYYTVFTELSWRF